MFSILLLGSGKSSSYLVKRLAKDALNQEISFTIADIQFEHLSSYLTNEELKSIHLQVLNLDNAEALNALFLHKNLAISMLPAMLHPKVAKVALENNVNFFTASYLSEEMKAFHKEALEKGLSFLNECGLDPGIDHLSAMDIIEKLKDDNAEIESFYSFCGGLVAPENDTNPWGYKFSWNPRNVVIAGQSTAKYLEAGEQKFIPYHQLFKRISSWHFPAIGNYEGYANRDSLAYKEIYGLHKIKTLQRGTLRKEGYCKAWDVFVQLGLTDDSYPISLSPNSSLPQFLNCFLPEDIANNDASIAERLSAYLGGLDDETLKKIAFLGFFDAQEKLPITTGTPAQILQAILEPKWQLLPNDKDMILMAHKFTYLMEGKRYELTSSLSVMGVDAVFTAMAKTVSLPLYIASKLLREGKLSQKGVFIPVQKSIYKPMLQALELEGIQFSESVKEI